MATAPSLLARALKALGQREHSRKELQAKLQPFAEDPDELDALLDELERRGWLSEARFVEQLTTTRRRKFGAARIVHELREKGVSDYAISTAQAQLKAGEVEAARAVWKKKFGKLPRSLQERGKQARFLASRGFSAEVVHAVLKKSRED
ncbi:MAG TPA: recombination regulator RecX [Burkholderiales bacterium]|nr:recombination regulator RecX [Burkholderiales bacterium]